MLGLAFNDVFVPILKTQFPEIVDFYLPAEACSYRIAVVSLRKEYAGHAKRVMFGVWSYLRQFMYTKFVIVVDEDIDARNWTDVVWALSTRVDPGTGLRHHREHPDRLSRFRFARGRARLEDRDRRDLEVARRGFQAMG